MIKTKNYLQYLILLDLLNNPLPKIIKYFAADRLIIMINSPGITTTCELETNLLIAHLLG